MIRYRMKRKQPPAQPISPQSVVPPRRRAGHRWLGLRDVARCFWQAVVDTVMHDGIEHAGYLAFLSMLSLFPFLVLLMTLAGILGELEIGQQFTAILLAHLPYDVAQALRPRIDEIVGGPPPGLLTVALLGAVWTASSAVEGLRTILNRAYRVSTPPSYPLRRLMSIVQLIVLLALVSLAMLAIVFVPLALAHLSVYVDIQHLVSEDADAWRLGISAAVLLLSAAGMYYVLPNTRQKFRATLPGAVLVVLMWMGFAWLFSEYLQQFDQVNFLYGSLGSLIAALFFFYLMAMILIFGAEFNYHLERALGHRIIEKEAGEAANPI